MKQALATVRDGGAVGYVGVPHGVELPVRELFGRNVSVGGGVAPVRAYLPELLADVVAGTLDPSPVFDVELASTTSPRATARCTSGGPSRCCCAPDAPPLTCSPNAELLAECGLFAPRESAFGE